MEGLFTVDMNRDRLDLLMSNMNELQINNLIEVLNIYMTICSMQQVQTRIAQLDADFNPEHEIKMRGVAEFQNFVGRHLKDTPTQ